MSSISRTLASIGGAAADASTTDAQSAAALALMGYGGASSEGQSDAPIPLLRNAVASAALSYASCPELPTTANGPNYDFLYNTAYSVDPTVSYKTCGAVFGGSVTPEVRQADIKDPEAARLAMALMGYGQNAVQNAGQSVGRTTSNWAEVASAVAGAVAAAPEASQPGNITYVSGNRDADPAVYTPAAEFEAQSLLTTAPSDSGAAVFGPAPALGRTLTTGTPAPVDSSTSSEPAASSGAVFGPGPASGGSPTTVAAATLGREATIAAAPSPVAVFGPGPALGGSPTTVAPASAGGRTTTSPAPQATSGATPQSAWLPVAAPAGPATPVAPSAQAPTAPTLPAGVRFDDTAAIGADTSNATATAVTPRSAADVDGYLPKAVALMSGNDLGLTGSSLDRLGGQGVLGQTARTTSGESLYINTATGNLVVQRTDELLVGLGPDAQVLRTYNSQAQADGDNNDNWRIGFYRQVSSLTGTVNTTGSSLVRVEADGSQRTYTFNGTLYVNQDGTGAHDTLSYNATNSTWTWTDGDSRVVETYAAFTSGAVGRLLGTQDIDGNTIAYAYNSAGLLTKVTTANTTGAQTNQTELVYDSTPGRSNNLLELKTTAWNAETNNNQVLTRTRYSYDANNRLERVTTDLSPEDNSVAATGSSNPNDGKTYSTTYTYDRDSNRIATITESNRARVSFVYDTQGRVTQFTEGGGRTTTLSYGDSSAGSTSTGAATNSTTQTFTHTLNETVLSAVATSTVVLARSGWSIGTNSQEFSGENGAASNVIDDNPNTIWHTGWSSGAVAGPHHIDIDTGTSQTISGLRYLPRPAGTYEANGRVSAYEIYVSNDGTHWGGAVASGTLANTLAEKEIVFTSTQARYVRLKTFADVNGNVYSSAAEINLIKTSPASTGYIVQTGDTWASIAQTAYKADAVEAAQALKTQFGGANTPQPGSVLSLVHTLQYDGVAATGTSATPSSSSPGATSVVITDPLGQQTQVINDAKGRLIEVRGPQVNGASQITRYQYDDATGQLRQHTDARGLVTAYEYDSAGNQTLVRDAAGNTTTRSYGALNQLLSQTRYAVADPDGAGAAQASGAETTRYVYNSQNKLRYAISAEGRVSEYRWGSSGNERGQQVASLQYTKNLFTTDGAVTEAVVDAWLNGGQVDKTSATRIDNRYDFRGQLASSTRYERLDANGNGVVDAANAASTSTTHYVYDAAGQLLKSIESSGGPITSGLPTGTVTQYAYDGLSRVYRFTDSLGVATLTQFDDALNRVTTTLANGLSTTRSYNQIGEMTGSVQAAASALGTPLSATAQFYDAAGRLRQSQDALGYRSHAVYDAAGRQVGAIEADGTLVETRYNAANQAVQTIRYANAVSNTQLAALQADVAAQSSNNANTVTLAQLRPTADASRDRVTFSLYDPAGRLAKTVDELGFVSEMRYDGASRVVSSVRYATALSAQQQTDLAQNILSTPAGASPTAAYASVAVNVAEDRSSRNFYDRDGRLQASLDAAGVLSENFYDGAGRLVHTVTYATPAASTLWVSGTLAQLRPQNGGAGVGGSTSSTAQDSHQWFFYDAKNQRVAELNAEGFLTEHRFDERGNKLQSTRYANVALIDPAQVSTTTTLAQLRPAPSTSGTQQDQTTRWTYTALSQVRTQVDHQGTVTQFTYNNVGQLIQTDKALGAVNAQGLSEQRTLQSRYDLQGRVISELTAQGSAALALLGNSASTAQVDTVWQQYGLTHSYDAAGRRTSTTDQNGAITRFFYNSDSQLVYTVNALGEVQENRYNALGELTHSIEYANRLNINALAAASPQTWKSGNAHNANVRAAVMGLASVNNATSLDSVRRFSYDQRGQLAASLDALSNYSINRYNAFGQQVEQTQNIDGTRSTTTRSSYDQRGLQRSTTVDAGDQGSGLNLLTKANYDAFGRVIEQTDALGKRSTFEYDRLGRVVQSTDRGNVARSTTYDAFDRVLTQVDGNGHKTQYNYNDQARSLTVTTAEGIQTVSTQNRHGQTIAVQDGRGNTSSYQYDKNGQLLSQTQDQLGLSTQNAYDRAGRLIETTDARGIKTKLEFDAVGRVLTRTVDPSGLALVTRYTYDAKGNQVSMLDANGVLSQTEVDRKGQTVRVTQDVGGLNLQTQYSYDAQGRTLVATDAKGVQTHYTYDNAGRRIQEVLDPSAPGYVGLNLTRRFEYDAAGNMTRSIDANGNASVYAYDDRQQLVYSVDALGNTQKQDYDAQGRVVKVTQYAVAINTAGLGSVASWGAGETPVSRIANRISQSANDLVQHRVYDKDGRMTASIQVVKEGQEGEVTQLVLDANGNVQERRAYANRLDMNTWVPGTLPLPAADDSRDVRVSTVFDAANRATHQIDGTGAVVKQVFDANGNVIDRIAYAKTVAPNTILHAAYIDSATAAIADANKDVRSQQVFDAAGRLQWRMDGVGAITQMAYDKVGNLTKTVQYANAANAAQSASSNLAQLVYSGISNSSADRATDFVYDNANRRTHSIDALGQVQQFRYDANGNLTQQVAYSRTVTAPSTNVGFSFGGGSITQYASTNIESQLGTAVDDAANRVARYAYDAANRQVFMVDAQNAITEQRFDGRGAVIQTIQYANAIAVDGLVASSSHSPSEQDIRNRLSTVPADNTQNRIQTNNYDAVGRLTVSVDGQGHATSHQIDALGRVTATTRHADKATVDAQGKVTLASASASNSNNRTDRFEYDQAGRLKSSTDVLQKKEQFIYDGLGRKTSFTNKNGATWTYQYDAGGRLTQETSPQVQLTSVMNLGSQLKEAATQNEAIVTQFSYDALGNLTEKREAVGRPGLEARSTQYVYDALGRQTKTLLPPVGIYNPFGDNLQATGAAGRSDAVNPSLYTETFYDTFGDAVAHRDTAGKFSYKTYDKLGRLAFDIDALGYLTQHQRNAFGDETALTRFAKASALGGSSGGFAKTQSTEQVRTVANSLKSSEDRTLVSEYNSRGQVVRVTEPATFVYDANTNTYNTVKKGTTNSYTTFGDVAQVSTSSGVGNTAVSTRFFYNQRGQQVASVDALGYLTTQQFDDAGNLIERKEFAKAIAGWQNGASDGATAPQQLELSSDDRTTRFEYDLANRKIREIQVGAYRQTYDDEIKTIQPVGNSPGDRVRILSKASGDGSAAANAAATAKTSFDVVSDLTTEFRYDAVGNLTKVVDAKGGVTYTYYDALGRTLAVAAPKAVLNSATNEQATPLVMFKRDAFGNVVSQTEYAQGAVDGITEQSNASALAKVADDSANRRMLTWYNKQGQAIQTSDAAGINRFVSYNAQGKVAKEWQSVSSNEGGAQPAVRNVFRLYEYDDLGRVISTVEPGSNMGTFASNVVLQKQTYNAFGEVVTRGSNSEQQRADFDYASGRWIMGSQKAEANSGAQEWFRYDNAGRLVATNADGGQVKAYLYNAQGQRTAQIQSAGVGRGNINLEGYFGLNLDLNDASKTGIQAIAELRDVRRTNYVLDALGRVIEERMPERVVSAAEAANASTAPAASVQPEILKGSPAPAPIPGFVIGGTPATPAPAPSGGAVFGPGPGASPAPSPGFVIGPTAPTPAPSGGAVFGPGPAATSALSSSLDFVIGGTPATPAPAPFGGAVFGGTTVNSAPSAASTATSVSAATYAGSVSTAAALAIMGYVAPPPPAPIPVSNAALDAEIATIQAEVDALDTQTSYAFTARHSAGSAANFAQNSLYTWNQMRAEHLATHGSLDASTGWSESDYQSIVGTVAQTAAASSAAQEVYTQAAAAAGVKRSRLYELLAAQAAAAAPPTSAKPSWGGGSAPIGSSTTPSAASSGTTTEKTHAQGTAGGGTIKTGQVIVGRSMDDILVLPPRQRPQEQWDSIKGIWRAHQGEPQVIIQWMTNYGVDAADLAFGSRQTLRQVGNYLLANGAGDGFAGWTAAQGYLGSGTVATSGVTHTIEQIGNLLRTLDWGIPEWDTVSTAQMYRWAKEFGWTLQDIASGFGFFTAQQIREHFAKYGYTLIAVPRELSPGQRHTVAEISDYLRSMDWGTPAWDTVSTQQTFAWAKAFGWTLQEIGDALGFTAQQIRDHLAKYGYTLIAVPRTLSPGQRHTVAEISDYLRSMDWGTPAWDTASTAQAYEWAEKFGWTLQEMGDALGFTAQQMREHFQKYNYTLSSDRLANRIKAEPGPAQGPSTLSTPPAPDASASRLSAPKVQRQYDRWGNVILITDPRGAQYQTTFKYNQNNQVVVQAVADLDKGDKAITQVHYDKLGKEVATTDANGNVEAKVYSATGQLLQKLHADDSVERHSYNAFGNAVSHTDGEGNTTQYVVDMLGRTTAVVHSAVDVHDTQTSGGNNANLEGPAHQGMRYTVDTQVWDEMGHLVQQTQGLSVQNATPLVSALQQASQKVARDSQNISFDTATATAPSTDPVLTALIKAFGGQETSVLGKTLRTTLEPALGQLGASTSVLRSTQLAYDLRGNLLSTTDALGNRNQSRYDNQDQKIFDADATGKSNSWRRDYFGQVFQHTDQSGADYSYTYDNARQLIEQVETNWLASRYTAKGKDNKVQRDAQGAPLSVIAGPQNITYLYDAAGQLSRIDDDGAGQATVYDYDFAGHRTLEVTTRDGIAFQGNENQYDYMGRLIQVDSINSFRVGTETGSDWQNKRVNFDTKTYQLFNPDIYAAWKQNNHGMGLEEFAAWHRGMYGAGEPSRITGSATALPDGQRFHNIAYVWTQLSALRTDKPYPTGPMAMAAYLQRNHISLDELLTALSILTQPDPITGRMPPRTRNDLVDYFEKQYKNQPSNGQSNSVADFDYDIDYAQFAAPERLQTDPRRQESLKLLMQSNLLRPQTLARVMLEYRVRPEELAQANGISLATLQLYFRNHGLHASQYDFTERPEAFNPDVSARVQDQIVSYFVQGGVQAAQGLAQMMLDLRLTTQDIALAASPKREILPSLVDLLMKNNGIGRSQYDITYRAIPDQFLLDLDQAVDAGGVLGRSLGANNSIRSITQRHLDGNGFAATQEAKPGELGNQPRAIAAMMLQYGVTAAELATAHGVNVQVVRDYFERFGIKPINYDPASLPSNLSGSGNSIGKSGLQTTQAPELTAAMVRQFMADAKVTAAGPSLIPPAQTQDQRLQAIATTWLRIATPRQDAASGPQAMAAYVVKNHITVEELRKAVELAQGTGAGSVKEADIRGYFEGNGWGIPVPKSDYDVAVIEAQATQAAALAEAAYQDTVKAAQQADTVVPARPAPSARQAGLFGLLLTYVRPPAPSSSPPSQAERAQQLAAYMVKFRITLQELVAAAANPPEAYRDYIHPEHGWNMQPSPWANQALTKEGLQAYFAQAGLHESQYNIQKRADAFDWPELARAAKIQHDIYNFFTNPDPKKGARALADYMLRQNLSTQDIALAAAPMREISASLVDLFMANNGITKDQYDVRLRAIYNPGTSRSYTDASFQPAPTLLPQVGAGGRTGGHPDAVNPEGKHPQTRVKIKYDAMGNRLQIDTQVNNTVTGPDNAPGINDGSNVQKQYFVYDAMNRQVGVNLNETTANVLKARVAADGGVLKSSSVNDALRSALNSAGLDEDSHILTYDRAGNRETDTYLGRKLVTYNGSAGLGAQANQAITERYFFDEQNRLIYLTRDDIKRPDARKTTQPVTPGGKDGRVRILQSGEGGGEGSADGAAEGGGSVGTGTGSGTGATAGATDGTDTGFNGTTGIDGVNSGDEGIAAPDPDSDDGYGGGGSDTVESGPYSPYEDNIRPATEWNGHVNTTPFALESRRYDALGQVLEVGSESNIAPNTIKLLYGENQGGGAGDNLSRTQYDVLGRVLRQQSWTSHRHFISKVSYAAPSDVSTATPRYNPDGSLYVQNPPQGRADIAAQLAAYNASRTTPNGYDAAGRLQQYTVTSGEGKAEQIVTYLNDYAYRDGALPTATTAYRKDKYGGFVSSTTLKTYDGNGHLRQVQDPNKANSDITRYFVTDAAGTVLRVWQAGDQIPQARVPVDAEGNALPGTTTNVTSATPDLTANEQFQLVANGQVLGRYGEMVNPDAPRDGGGRLQFIADQNLDFVYQSVADGAARGNTTYTVVKGDTLQSIAKAVLGDANLWFTIAQANGLADSADLEEGQLLRIPAVVLASTNNDGAFVPYDPTRVVGDTSPVLPPPAKKKTNVLAQIVIVIVVVVVAYFTQQWYLMNYATATTAAGVTVTGTAASSAVAAGAASYTAGSVIAAGAIAGAAGSIAGQLTGMALGEQDKFSWKQVGLGALGGGISGGLSQVSALSNSALGGAFQGAATRGAISSALTQGIGVATGMQEKFSWTAVAASALSAGVAEHVGQAIGGANWQTTQRGTDYFQTSLISNAAGSLTRGAVMARGGKIDWGQVAADTFGQTIGNSLVQGHRLDSQQEQRLQYTENLRDAEMTRLMNMPQPAQPQGIGPWSAYGYENGADIADTIAREQRQRVGFIQAGVDAMGPESGIWGNQAAIEQEKLLQRSEDLRDKAMAGLGADRQVQALNAGAKARSNALTAAARSSPTEVASYSNEGRGSVAVGGGLGGGSDYGLINRNAQSHLRVAHGVDPLTLATIQNFNAMDFRNLPKERRWEVMNDLAWRDQQIAADPQSTPAQKAVIGGAVRTAAAMMREDGLFSEAGAPYLRYPAEQLQGMAVGGVATMLAGRKPVKLTDDEMAARAGTKTVEANGVISSDLAPGQTPQQKLASILHQVELGKDPAKGGKFVVDESITGTRIEQQSGTTLRRDPSGNGDWIAPGGKVLDGASPPPTQYFNDKTVAQWKQSIQSHLNKQGVDVIVIDPVQRGLSAAQTKVVTTYIQSLPAAQRSRILILN